MHLQRPVAVPAGVLVVWSYPTCFLQLSSSIRGLPERHWSQLSCQVYRVPQLCSAEHGAGAAAGNQSAAACAGSMAWGQERSTARRPCTGWGSMYGPSRGCMICSGNIPADKPRCSEMRLLQYLYELQHCFYFTSL